MSKMPSEQIPSEFEQTQYNIFSLSDTDKSTQQKKATCLHEGVRVQRNELSQMGFV